MALQRITEFVNHLAEQPNALEGFNAKTFYETGMTFGLTCREICDNFLGAQRAISRGKYPAVLPDSPLASSKSPTVKPLKAAAKKAPKVAKAPKAPKVAKAPKAPKAAKVVDAEHVVSEFISDADPEPTGAVFEYIADAAEINCAE